MLLLLSGLLACATPAEPRAAAPEGPAKSHPALTEPYGVENWLGTWTGLRPEYPLLNPQGEVIVVRGREAKVGASTFTFTIGAMGQAELIQAHGDGRVAEFSGTWKGRTRPGTQDLDAIVCDLTANSTGAYRQFALMVDDAQQAVLCHGTSAEPVFAVTFSQP